MRCSRRSLLTGLLNVAHCLNPSGGSLPSTLIKAKFPATKAADNKSRERRNSSLSDDHNAITISALVISSRVTFVLRAKINSSRSSAGSVSKLSCILEKTCTNACSESCAASFRASSRLSCNNIKWVSPSRPLRHRGGVLSVGDDHVIWGGPNGGGLLCQPVKKQASGL